jgi:hypothetical protein
LLIHTPTACEREARETLQRIADTLDQVPDVTLHNVLMLNDATHGMIASMMRLMLLVVPSEVGVDTFKAWSAFTRARPLYKRGSPEVGCHSRKTQGQVQQTICKLTIVKTTKTKSSRERQRRG